MRFRMGLALGFGAGYYLGAKAGRERYEQINRLVDKVKRTDTFEMASERTRDVVGTATEKARAAADLGAERAKDLVHSTSGNGSGKTSAVGDAETPDVDVPDTDPPIRP